MFDMKPLKRYKFIDHNGNQRGIKNVDRLDEAIQIAIDYQCEVVDIEATQSPIVYSAWDGWNVDYDFYKEGEHHENYTYCG